MEMEMLIFVAQVATLLVAILILWRLTKIHHYKVEMGKK